MNKLEFIKETISLPTGDSFSIYHNLHEHGFDIQEAVQLWLNSGEDTFTDIRFCNFVNAKRLGALLFTEEEYLKPNN